MNKQEIFPLLPDTLEELDFEKLEDRHRVSGVVRGKVRDMADLNGNLLIVTTDRISAFDKVLTTIPCKGEVLNQLSLFWFHKTSDIISNHVVHEVSGRSVLVRKCDVLPVEVVVRGYLTGSAWRDYHAGKAISGIQLPEGLRYNQKFDQPLITPSTKEERGEHDRPISRDEIIDQDLIPRELWERIEDATLKLYKRGRETALERGLVLVDTKYEFGMQEEELFLIDELHTPDSSRFWYADTYDELFAAGENQRELDKEYLRRWLMDRGYMGDGPPPDIPDDIRIEVALRYIQTYEMITGRVFTPSGKNSEEEIRQISGHLSG